MKFINFLSFLILILTCSWTFAFDVVDEGVCTSQETYHFPAGSEEAVLRHHRKVFFKALALGQDNYENLQSILASLGSNPGVPSVSFIHLADQFSASSQEDVSRLSLIPADGTDIRFMAYPQEVCIDNSSGAPLIRLDRENEKIDFYKKEQAIADQPFVSLEIPPVPVGSITRIVSKMEGSQLRYYSPVYEIHIPKEGEGGGQVIGYCPLSFCSEHD